MSQQLINRSPDLKLLRDEGYDVGIVGTSLVVGSVPYVTANREVKLGSLVSDLTVTDDVAKYSGHHVVYFAGDLPCDQHGKGLMKILLNHDAKDFGSGLRTQHQFSSKPPENYRDYHHKMVTYITMLLTPAQVLDPSVKATVFPALPVDEKESVFHYFDSATSRAEIGAAMEKLAVPRIAIVGLGGTGAYVLDLVSKVPALEIHLYDGDRFHQHNAFRSPGAASIEEIAAQPMKVDYFAGIYSKMHRHIKPHAVYIDENNVHELREMSHVFFCLDKNKIKQCMFQELEEAGVSFIDVGMGLQLIDGALTGMVRTTTSTASQRGHVAKHVSFVDMDLENMYSKNIQIADLNALNATLAVIKWKKLCGFYHDLDKENQSLYIINGNVLNNTEKA